MKIIAILESDITAGGAFSQGLNAILQMKRICDGDFDFEVFTISHGALEVLEGLGVHAELAEITLFDRLVAIFARTTLGARVFSKFKICGPLENKIISRGGDIVYFLTQSSGPEYLQKTNFILTVFDLCHRDFPEFPEVSSFGVFESREVGFQDFLNSASIVVAESIELSKSIQRRYGVDSNRCVAMPMSASPLIAEGGSKEVEAILSLYGLQEGYFFYPAQFWAHKNHVRIVEAMAQLHASGVKCRAVFVGSDKGNLKHVQNIAKNFAVDGFIDFLGFVPSNHLRALYLGCCAVVMPTYFGPTNLPPLEAWELGKPLIYSEHLREQVGEAAFLVDPDDAFSLARAMERCLLAEGIEENLEQAKLRLENMQNLRNAAEVELKQLLKQFEVRRRCWK